MTYTPTREELELAALACGIKGEWSDTFPNPPKGEPMFIPYGGERAGKGDWKPHLDAGDRMAMIDKLCLEIEWVYDIHRVPEYVNVTALQNGYVQWMAPITNGNKQAALAEAALKVAAQVGAKMRLEKL